MSRNAEQNQRQETSAGKKILYHALRLFSANGLAATKVSHIAAAAQMSQGLLYHYFPSKEAIFTELIRDAFAR